MALSPTQGDSLSDAELIHLDACLPAEAQRCGKLFARARLAGTGARVLAEHPAAILWLVQNRMREALLPLERLRRDGRSAPPRYVTLKPTLRCNLRCEFCRFVANGDVFGKRDWLELEEWKQIVDGFAPGRPYVCVTGGEPLLYPHAAELIAHVKRRGMLCVLTTNGTLLEARAETLLEEPPDAVVLSLDGPRSVHNAVRKVPGTYDRALRGARKLLALRRGPRPYLVVNAAITGHTYASALDMVAVAREFGALALNFQHFWFMTPGMVEAHNARWGGCFPLDADRLGITAAGPVDTDRLYETIRRLQDNDWGLPILFYPELTREEMRLYYSEPERFIRNAPPACAWTSTDILPNGDVSPCFEMTPGNALRQPFAEIWNSAELRGHRRRLAEHGPYPVCARCCAYFRKD
jgi:Fe-coproporphyrin III synthase